MECQDRRDHDHGAQASAPDSFAGEPFTRSPGGHMLLSIDGVVTAVSDTV
ncbi:MAG: hypothetical protein JWM93_3541, partial [Frankiales bacterium]|nr:hypothetical protein [Frankiales bacterium]